MKVVAAFSLVSTLTSVVLGGSAELSRFHGEGTTYTLDTPTSGNCNFQAFPPAASKYFAAINGVQFLHTKNCGRCALVRCVDKVCAHAPSVSEVVYIVDQCPECAFGDLDLSADAFESITGFGSGRVAIEWEFVDCPVDEEQPIEYCLKGGSNGHWVAVQPANFVVGIKNVQINDATTKMVDSAYYFLLENDQAVDLSNVKMTVESVDGQMLEETVALKAGECTAGNAQFQRLASLAPAPIETEAPSASEVEEPTQTDVSIEEAPQPTPEGTTPAPVETKPASPEESPATESPQNDTPTVATVAPALQEKEISTESENEASSSTSPAIIILAATAGVALVALVVLAVIVKRKRHLEEKNSDRPQATFPRSGADHGSIIMVTTHAYDRFETPARRADIAVL